MAKHLLLEICGQSLDAAVAAECGGADRIELCEELRVGGVTPGARLMAEARAAVRIPIFAMIRPRAGDFCYSEAELEQMKREIEAARAAGMNGMVLGILTSAGRVDVERTAELVELAKPLPVTFHRAFDGAIDARSGMEEVISTGAARILTSGGQATAESGIEKIAGLVEASRGRIEIMPGGGIRSGNLEWIAQGTRAREFHSGVSELQLTERWDAAKFEAEVRRMAEILQSGARG